MKKLTIVDEETEYGVNGRSYMRATTAAYGNELVFQAEDDEDCGLHIHLISPNYWMEEDTETNNHVPKEHEVVLEHDEAVALRNWLDIVLENHETLRKNASN